MYDSIYSNIDYVNKLFTNGVSPDNISESALKGYYTHTYFIQVKKSGFSQLEKEINKNPSILYYIRHGLKSIRAIKNLNLFNQYIALRERGNNQNHNILNKLFIYINKEENLLQLNDTWLQNSTQLSNNNSSNKYKNINIKMLKKLCKIANEDYVRITSYDQNNLYNNACYFKTLNSHFYMIEEKERYVMYNSFTKKEVSTIRIKRAKRKSFLSTLIKRIER